MSRGDERTRRWLAQLALELTRIQPRRLGYVASGKTYKPNGSRECARRMKQAAKRTAE